MFGEPDFGAVAFGAHPDDVEICCGGTLAKLADRGYGVAIITLTSGELGTRGSRETRAQEFAEAARILGAREHRMLDIPDGGVAATREYMLKVVQEIRRLRPRVVFTHHWESRHPDHAHGSHLVREAVFFAGLPKIDTGQPPWRPYKLIFFANRFEFQPSFVVDISQTFERKMRAVRAYQSQFHGPDMERYGEEQTAISHPAFLDHIEVRARQYGIYIGARYAEPFLVREALAVDDPVALFDERCYYSIP